MSDEAYSLVAALTMLASLAALYFRWRARRAYRRLLKMLEESRKQQQEDETRR